MQRLALAIQAAVVIVLTVAGGLLVRSLVELLDVDPGFDPKGAMAIRVDPAGRLAGPARLPFFDRVLDGVRAVPAVESAALTIHVPMETVRAWDWMRFPKGAHNPVVDNTAGRILSPGYFGTIGVRIVAGRDFDASDIRARLLVMAINETFARQIQAEGRDPLRSRFTVLGNVRQVVAVVRDVRHRSLDAEAGREVYIPMGQAPGFFQAYDLLSARPIRSRWFRPFDRRSGLSIPIRRSVLQWRSRRTSAARCGRASSDRRHRRIRWNHAATRCARRLRRRPSSSGAAGERDCDQGRARCTGLARHGGRAGRHNRVRRSGARRWRSCSRSRQHQPFAAISSASSLVTASPSSPPARSCSRQRRSPRIFRHVARHASIRSLRFAPIDRLPAAADHSSLPRSLRGTWERTPVQK